ncbi:MAG: ATP-binding cassette domain-containing protein [Candidatus Pacebacteria bacterium]|nr:ATP-binding cassette domain-containing protein [Candidatus Paceibacterota bacterium]PIR64064.1 MAG: ABC transporter [Candidatus Pacebacteria bacterium CG10_big_fil_rev_8_21_14_0_10_40_26]PIZ78168.1 MAG: ABC transporter [Candidatus Pacebacteria bacterium CG_4_10_14_0_2_um_filter_40_20]PJA69140.1 MAG: ABC transporter [Candidatus Pacebacteria bacterium CG_4_9_14_3_um_filter_40_12]PJC41727.1 MAG: ABC transporter [Candidatus Pacebacteria bacterium CG_4_9_14_0_2_um_filter_40_15]
MSKPPIISITNLKKHFKVYKKKPGLWGSIQSLWHREYEVVKAVDGISFDIAEGEIVGFIGMNGAGKTTTLKMLSGLLYPTEGQPSVLGYNPWERKASFQKQFALVMGQKNQLWWDLPAVETFYLNKAIYEIPDEQFEKTLKKLVKLLDVEDIIRIQVRKLSLGQRMKCELIAALLHNPKVLFLDEPTIGLDVVMQKTLRDFIKAYNKEFGATIILTSHYMDDVKELCERAIIIDHGKKIFDGKLQDIIDKYARNKKLSLVFSEPVTKKDLQAFGDLKEFSDDGSHYTATLLVARKKATAVAAQVLSKFPVVDVTIEEPPIEAIIREVFSKEGS